MTRLPTGAVIDLATLPRQELEWIAATALTALEARDGAAKASVPPKTGPCGSKRARQVSMGGHGETVRSGAV